jgi:NADPH:quinone reductase-like Zn-dependent oxidoreductase
MRVIAIDDFGAEPALRDVPEPDPAPGEVLVRVEASAINGFDLAVAGGMLQEMMDHRFPVILGKDFAGTVERVGEGVTRFGPGDRVFGVVMKPALGDGAFGEYVAVSEEFGITILPAGLDVAIAGAIGLTGTAARMAVSALGLAPGQTVLISGATGGVGVQAVQLAAATGAEVIATARTGQAAELVRMLGAAATVDYGGDLAAAVRALRPAGVDAVLHLAGDGLQLADLLVDGGRFASTLGMASEHLADRQVTATAVMALPDATTLDRLAADAAEGRLRLPISRSYRLEDVPQGLKDFAAGTLGKLAVTVG